MRSGIAALTLTLAALASPGARGEAPTFHKDVEAILQKNCQDCHRPGQVAPFSLLTFDQARKRGTDIAHVTGERIMPPWPASTTFGGPFRDQRVPGRRRPRHPQAPGSTPAAPRGTPRTPRNRASSPPTGPSARPT